MNEAHWLLQPDQISRQASGTSLFQLIWWEIFKRLLWQYMDKTWWACATCSCSHGLILLQAFLTLCLFQCEVTSFHNWFTPFYSLRKVWPVLVSLSLLLNAASIKAVTLTNFLGHLLWRTSRSPVCGMCNYDSFAHFAHIFDGHSRSLLHSPVAG